MLFEFMWSSRRREVPWVVEGFDRTAVEDGQFQTEARLYREPTDETRATCYGPNHRLSLFVSPSRGLEKRRSELT